MEAIFVKLCLCRCTYCYISYPLGQVVRHCSEQYISLQKPAVMRRENFSAITNTLCQQPARAHYIHLIINSSSAQHLKSARRATTKIIFSKLSPRPRRLVILSTYTARRKSERHAVPHPFRLFLHATPALMQMIGHTCYMAHC